ncbi:MAG TPA: hypothetical protein VFG45_05625 [Candidatus Nitrosocosmicus sp.]|nr:hypothetical protein [Candidatus Nitrosocosmicus sp.]
MSKIITQNKKSKTFSGGYFLFIALLVTGSTLGLGINTPQAMGENLKQFKLADRDLNYASLALPQDSFLGLKGNNDGTASKDTNVDVGETIIVNGDHCGVEDEDSGTSYPIDCETGEPL